MQQFIPNGDDNAESNPLLAEYASEQDVAAQQQQQQQPDFPPVRNHSYLPALHPLYTAPRVHNQCTDSNCTVSASTASSEQNNNFESSSFPDKRASPSRRSKRSQLQELTVLELPEVVVFPHDRLPLRLSLQHSQWYRNPRSQEYLQQIARQIDAARHHPGSSPPVRLGVLLVNDSLSAKNNRVERERLARRESWTRRGMGPERLRRFSQRLRQELGSLEDDDDEEMEHESNEMNESDESNQVVEASSNARAATSVSNANLALSSSSSSSQNSSPATSPTRASNPSTRGRFQFLQRRQNERNNSTSSTANSANDRQQTSLETVNDVDMNVSANQNTVALNPIDQFFGDWLYVRSHNNFTVASTYRGSTRRPAARDLIGNETIYRRSAPTLQLPSAPRDAIDHRIRAINMLVGLYDTFGNNSDETSSNGPTDSTRDATSDTSTHKGRVGTIVTVMYTHGDDAQQTSVHDSVWQTHEQQDELVLTAVGTSRFRIISSLEDSLGNGNPHRLHPYLQNNHIVSIGRYLVEEIEDEVVAPAMSGLRPISSTHNTVSSEPFHATLQRQQLIIRTLANVTPLPVFVLKKYWPWRLVTLIQQVIQSSPTFVGVLESLNSLKKDYCLSTTLTDPTRFSYWLASNLPLAPEEKLELLNLDTTVERLRYILQKVGDVELAESIIHCKRCGIPLANANALFTVSGAEGTSGHYVNMHGDVHQTITVRTVDKDEVRCYGLSETRDSWFPGYSWKMMSCACCLEHLGWHFISVTKNNSSPDRPVDFYGLRAAKVSTYVPERRRRRRDDDS